MGPAGMERRTGGSGLPDLNIHKEGTEVADNYALELKQITKRFGSVLANDHVDLTLKKSEILAILGENAAARLR